MKAKGVAIWPSNECGKYPCVYSATNWTVVYWLNPWQRLDIDINNSSDASKSALQVYNCTLKFAKQCMKCQWENKWKNWTTRCGFFARMIHDTQARTWEMFQRISTNVLALDSLLTGQDPCSLSEFGAWDSVTSLLIHLHSNSTLFDPLPAWKNWTLFIHRTPRMSLLFCFF